LGYFEAFRRVEMIKEYRLFGILHGKPHIWE
jgi:hypothetical protein